jgi:hypothetical protein
MHRRPPTAPASPARPQALRSPALLGQSLSPELWQPLVLLLGQAAAHGHGQDLDLLLADDPLELQQLAEALQGHACALGPALTERLALAVFQLAGRHSAALAAAADVLLPGLLLGLRGGDSEASARAARRLAGALEAVGSSADGTDVLAGLMLEQGLLRVVQDDVLQRAATDAPLLLATIRLMCESLCLRQQQQAACCLAACL